VKFSWTFILITLLALIVTPFRFANASSTQLEPSPYYKDKSGVALMLPQNLWDHNWEFRVSWAELIVIVNDARPKSVVFRGDSTNGDGKPLEDKQIESEVLEVLSSLGMKGIRLYHTDESAPWVYDNSIFVNPKDYKLEKSQFENDEEWKAYLTGLFAHELGHVVEYYLRDVGELQRIKQTFFSKLPVYNRVKACFLHKSVCPGWEGLSETLKIRTYNENRYNNQRFHILTDLIGIALLKISGLPTKLLADAIDVNNQMYNSGIFGSGDTSRPTEYEVAQRKSMEKRVELLKRLELP